MTTDGATYSVEDLRRQLLRNGYTPLPNRDKRCFLDNWPHVEVDDDLIHGWERRPRFRATGIRVENGLAVIDVDVDGGSALAAALYDAVWTERPAEPLIRYGGGTKEAWFVRCSESFSRIHSRSFMKPGAKPDDPAHRVEIFGGLSPRQFGAFGAHTIDDDTGETKRTYSWEGGDDPSNTPLAELPLLTKDAMFAVVDRIEAVLVKAGYEPVLMSSKGENDLERVYDLTDEMRFDLNTGDTLSLHDLRDLARRSEGLRCSAGWLEGPSAKRRDRCIVGATRAGNLTIWESASGVTHMEAAVEPPSFEEALDRARERIAELAEQDKQKVRRGDSKDVAAAKLLETYAFCGVQTRAVVPIYPNSADDGMSLTAFRQLMLPWSEAEIGPRGGEKRVNPADVWACNPKRPTVGGVRLRPDMARPIFTENGEDYVNAYKPPIFADAAKGGIDGGMELIEQLLPDARERQWFLDWLAFKFVNPGVPGPAVIMLARAFGTGRGTLGQLVKRLFGENYVRSLPFSIFAGQSYQSQYTDWRATALVVLVNESSDVGETVSVHRAKRNVYEHLKEIVEPRAERATIIRKTDPSYETKVCASYLVFTNNPDAIPLPPDDRRFAVLSNGEPRDETFWNRINAWLDRPENIAAFAAMLETRDLSDYNPYAVPPKTDAKTTMSDLSRSDLDRAIDLVIDSLVGEAMTMSQIEAGVRQVETQYGFTYPDRWQVSLRREAARRLHRVGVPNGQNWLVTVGDQRLPVYTRTRKACDKWTNGNPSGLRAEVLKNGSAKATGLPGNVINFFTGKIAGQSS